MTYANDYCKTVETYYGELKKCPPISREEEEKLFKLVKQDDMEARNKILTSNLQFVVDVAKGYKGYGVSMPEPSCRFPTDMPQTAPDDWSESPS